MRSLGRPPFESPAAVFEQRRWARRGIVLRVAVVLLRPQRVAREKPYVLSQDAHVPRGGDVFGGDEGEPQHVVGAGCSHAAPGGRVPPVKDVPLFELVGRRLEDVGAGPLRRAMQEGHDVLQLIAESERTARLVEGGATEDARRQALVEEPPVEHQVHGRIRRLDADAPEQPIPERVESVPGRFDGRAFAEARHELQRFLAAARLTQHEVRLQLFAGRKLEVHLQRSAGIHTRVETPREAPPSQRFGPRVVAATAQKLGAVGGKAVHLLPRGQKRDASAEIGVPVATGENAIVGAIDLRRNVGPLLLATTPERPLGVVGRGDPPPSRQRVLEAQANDLQRSIGGTKTVSSCCKPWLSRS